MCQEDDDSGPKTTQKRIAPQTMVKIEPNQMVQPAVEYLRMRPITNPDPSGQARIAIKY